MGCRAFEPIVVRYFEKFQIKYKDITIEESVSIPPVKDKAQLETIDVNSIGVEDSRTFGGEHLCSQILEKLDFAHCLDSLGFNQKEIEMAHISIISRALFSSSGYKTTQYLRDNSELKRMFGFEEELISLSNGLDKKGTTKKIEKVWERIGRLKEKYRLVSGKYTIEADANDGIATRVTWQKKEPEKTRATEHGVYFIRTNFEKSDEIQFWSTRSGIC